MCCGKLPPCTPGQALGHHTSLVTSCLGAWKPQEAACVIIYLSVTIVLLRSALSGGGAWAALAFPMRPGIVLAPDYSKQGTQWAPGPGGPLPLPHLDCFVLDFLLCGPIFLSLFSLFFSFTPPS